MHGIIADMLSRQNLAIKDVPSLDGGAEIVLHAPFPILTPDMSEQKRSNILGSLYEIMPNMDEWHIHIRCFGVSIAIAKGMPVDSLVKDIENIIGIPTGEACCYSMKYTSPEVLRFWENLRAEVDAARMLAWLHLPRRCIELSTTHDLQSMLGDTWSNAPEWVKVGLRAESPSLPTVSVSSNTSRVAA